MSAKIRGNLLLLHWKTEFDDEIYHFGHNNSVAACGGRAAAGC